MCLLLWEEIIGFESGDVKGSFLLSNGGKVSSLASGVGELYEKQTKKVFAEIIYQFKTKDGKLFQPRLKRLVDSRKNIIWETGV